MAWSREPVWDECVVEVMRVVAFRDDHGIRDVCTSECGLCGVLSLVSCLLSCCGAGGGTIKGSSPVTQLVGGERAD